MSLSGGGDTGFGVSDRKEHSFLSVISRKATRKTRIYQHGQILTIGAIITNSLFDIRSRTLLKFKLNPINPASVVRLRFRVCVKLTLLTPIKCKPVRKSMNRCLN